MDGDLRKSKPFTEYEKNLAIALIKKRISIVDGKKTDHTSLLYKKKEWDKIASEFNTSHNVQQKVTGNRLKKFWSNTKNKARDAKTRQNQWKRTGVGSPEQGLTNTEKSLSAVFTQGEEGDCDSPARQPKLKKNENSITLPLATAPFTITPELNQFKIEVTDDVVLQTNSIDFCQPSTSYSDPLSSEVVSEVPEPTERNVTSHKEKVTFEDMKIKVLEEQIEQNKKKFELYISQQKELHALEVAFRKKLYELKLKKKQSSKDSENSDFE